MDEDVKHTGRTRRHQYKSIKTKKPDVAMLRRDRRTQDLNLRRQMNVQLVYDLAHCAALPDTDLHVLVDKLPFQSVKDTLSLVYLIARLYRTRNTAAAFRGLGVTCTPEHGLSIVPDASGVGYIIVGSVTYDIGVSPSALSAALQNCVVVATFATEHYYRVGILEAVIRDVSPGFPASAGAEVSVAYATVSSQLHNVVRVITPALPVLFDAISTDLIDSSTMMYLPLDEAGHELWPQFRLLQAMLLLELLSGDLCCANAVTSLVYYFEHRLSGAVEMSIVMGRQLCIMLAPLQNVIPFTIDSAVRMVSTAMCLLMQTTSADLTHNFLMQTAIASLSCSWAYINSGTREALNMLLSQLLVHIGDGDRSVPLVMRFARAFVNAGTLVGDGMLTSVIALLAYMVKVGDNEDAPFIALKILLHGSQLFHRLPLKSLVELWYLVQLSPITFSDACLAVLTAPDDIFLRALLQQTSAPHEPFKHTVAHVAKHMAMVGGTLSRAELREWLDRIAALVPADDFAAKLTYTLFRNDDTASLADVTMT